MFFDPMYLVFAAPGLLLAAWASWRVQHNFAEYSQVGTSSGMTGAQAAQILLDTAGIRDVEIVAVPGSLTDHYDPTNKRLALSEQVFGSTSVAAVGVATHEAGHAIQHAHGYFPMFVRSATVIPAQLGSSFAPLIFFAGVIMSAKPLVLVGLALFAAALFFQLVTLPVEFDATRRAKELVVQSGIVYPEERYGIDKVLNAAAWTYVAAALTGAMTFLYYLLRSGLLGGRSSND